MTRWILLALICTGVGVLSAQVPDESESESVPAGVDQTMQDLLELRDSQAPGQPATPGAEAVEPQQRDGVEYVPSRVGLPEATVDVDRSVLGVAPGQPQPQLRREGDFVVNRRGRLIRSPDGAHVLFTFDADDQASPEAPMIMLPCRNLESMENYVADRGDSVRFVVSGQVHVYRGANYLLPTMWKLAYDQGNLQN